MSLKKLNSLLVLLLIPMLILSGCSYGRKQLNPNIAFPSRPYEHGITHRDAVLGELGPPLKMSVLPDGYIFMYEGLDVRELQLGLSLPIPYMSWLKYVWGNAVYDHHVMVYQFDKKGLLVCSSGTVSDFDLGSSMAVQPVITVQSLFDTSAVEDEIVDFTEWPAFCLLPLPQTLNRANTMNVGVAGVEQRGTSPAVGQRTLEMHQ